jgi:hypothetical protein
VGAKEQAVQVPTRAECELDRAGGGTARRLPAEQDEQRGSRGQHGHGEQRQQAKMWHSLHDASVAMTCPSTVRPATGCTPGRPDFGNAAESALQPPAERPRATFALSAFST